MEIHEVQQGEDMITIALKYNIADWKSLYNHEFNARLREFRPNPMVLFPGDIVLIPDLTPVVYKFQTNQVHTIQIDLPKVTISLNLLDEDGQALAGIPYELSGEGFEFKQESNGDGLVEHSVPYETKSATLIYWPDKENTNFYIERELLLGHLDPIDEVSGMQARMNNIGLDAGPLDNDFGPKTNAALQAVGGIETLKKKTGE